MKMWPHLVLYIGAVVRYIGHAQYMIRPYCYFWWHYGFRDEELDFIPSTSLRTSINYDIKYRMG